MKAPEGDVVGELVAHLADPANAEPPVSFPLEPSRADHPGLYAWWADGDGLAVLSAPFGESLGPPIYAGQTGATSTRSAKQRSATLRSRISANHLNGNVASSTFRETLTAVLSAPLSLHPVAPRRLDNASNRALSIWMHHYLCVAIVPFDDRDDLAAVEQAVLARLDQPLNLMGMRATTIRR
jgi:hypothetical protein